MHGSATALTEADYSSNVGMATGIVILACKLGFENAPVACGVYWELSSRGSKKIRRVEIDDHSIGIGGNVVA